MCEKIFSKLFRHKLMECFIFFILLNIPSDCFHRYLSCKLWWSLLSSFQIYLSDVCDAGFVSHLVIIAGIQLVFPVTHIGERQTMRTAAWLEKTELCVCCRVNTTRIVTHESSFKGNVTSHWQGFVCECVMSSSHCEDKSTSLSNKGIYLPSGDKHSVKKVNYLF